MKIINEITIISNDNSIFYMPNILNCLPEQKLHVFFPSRYESVFDNSISEYNNNIQNDSSKMPFNYFYEFNMLLKNILEKYVNINPDANFNINNDTQKEILNNISVNIESFFTILTKNIINKLKGKKIKYIVYGNEKEDFYISGDAMGYSWIKPIMRDIIRYAFYDKNIFYLNDYNKPGYKSNLHIRSTHFWFKNSADDYKNPNIVPVEPYIDIGDIPYICWSGEPFRCDIDKNKNLIYEMNTYKKTNSTIKKNINNETDEKLKKNAIWWGEKYFYFTENSINGWIPYISIVDMDTMKKINEFKNYDIKKNIRNDHFLTINKEYDFVYIASNCTQYIREHLFSLLKSKDEKFCDEKKRKVKSLGKCQRTDTVNMNTYWLYNTSEYCKYKFVFAIENSLIDGYITEKILLPFISNSIPIYYGPDIIKNYFNENSFYYLNDKFRDPENPTAKEIYDVSDELYKLSQDDTDKGWRKYLKEKVYINDTVPFFLNIDVIKNQYFNHMGNSLRSNYEQFLEEKNTVTDGKQNSRRKNSRLKNSRRKKSHI